jgi:Zn-dependent protease
MVEQLGPERRRILEKAYFFSRRDHQSMRLSWKLGRVAGIDLFLHPTFLLLLAFVGMTNQDSLVAISIVAAAFGCVLLHELGHALAARQFGIQTLDITLYPIGGVARLTRMPRAPGAELLIALAGPAVNVVLAALFTLLAGAAHMAGPSAGGMMLIPFLAILVQINLGLALFNMIPAFPMDGGRVMRAILSGRLGRLRATEIAARLGQALAVVFGVYCLLHGAMLQAFLAMFVFMAARMELAHVTVEERLRAPARPDSGVWVAPPGYHWVSRGPGLWQLSPIAVTVSDVPQ